MNSFGGTQVSKKGEEDNLPSGDLPDVCFVFLF